MHQSAQICTYILKHFSGMKTRTPITEATSRCSSLASRLPTRFWSSPRCYMVSSSMCDHYVISVIQQIRRAERPRVYLTTLLI